MDKAYKELYKDVQRLRYKLQDFLDDPAHNIAQSIKRDIQRLEDEMEMSKSPRSLEDRAKGIQNQLQSLTDQVMDKRHADEIHDGLDELRRGLKSLPNY